MNIYSHICLIFWGKGSIISTKTRLQVFLSIIFVSIGLISLFYDNLNVNNNNNNTSIFSNCFGMFCFVMYHILCYIHKGHSDIAKKRHKVFGRIQPFGLLLSAFILAILSLFAHIVELKLET